MPHLLFCAMLLLLLTTKYAFNNAAIDLSAVFGFPVELIRSRSSRSVDIDARVLIVIKFSEFVCLF
jgi:hypothetical protein